MQPPFARRVDSLAMELRVHRVRPDLPRMQLAPQHPEPVVVLTTAERARAVTGGERGRLVEEEELCELAGLKERPALPAAELEPARDPPLTA